VREGGGGGGEGGMLSERDVWNRERRKRGCKSGVERHSEGECKRGEGRATESEREKKLELE
jgi:hypothetical protein